MAEQPYWNPRHETMPREELTALQVHKLRRLVEWADASVPWHSKRLRDAGVTADQIHSIDDLRRIPFLTRDEWMNAQQEPGIVVDRILVILDSRAIGGTHFAQSGTAARHNLGNPE